jgi:hypothetical protein
VLVARSLTSQGIFLVGTPGRVALETLSQGMLVIQRPKVARSHSPSPRYRTRERSLATEQPRRSVLIAFTGALAGVNDALAYVRPNEGVRRRNQIATVLVLGQFYAGVSAPMVAVLHHHFSASLGDLIAVAALALAWLTFRLDRAASDRGEVLAALSLLRGAREGFFRAIGDFYFAGIYTDAAAKQRAQTGAGGLDHVFVLPTEPIAALIADQRAVAAGLISPDTVVRATVALWQLRKINELVREQAMFNAVHAPDFVDKSIPADRRAAVVEGGVGISAFLHGKGIGDARDSWYEPLKTSVDQDLGALESRGGWKNALRRNAAFMPGDVAALAAVSAVAAAYINSI